MLPAAPAHAFSGVTIAGAGGAEAITNSGPAFPRFVCPAAAFVFCKGRVTFHVGRIVVGRAPIALRSNDAISLPVLLHPAARDYIHASAGASARARALGPPSGRHPRPAYANVPESALGALMRDVRWWGERRTSRSLRWAW